MLPKGATHGCRTRATSTRGREATPAAEAARAYPDRLFTSPPAC